MSTAEFGLRYPTMFEVRKAFGSAKRALEVTRGDLPTCLYFLANPDKIAWFKSPKGARRAGYADFAKQLRDAVREENKSAKSAKDNARAEEIARLVKEVLQQFDVSKRLKIGQVKECLMSKLRGRGILHLYVTTRDIRAAVEDINITSASVWRLPEVKPRKPRGKRSTA